MPNVLLATVNETEARAVLEVFSEATGLEWKRRFGQDQTYHVLGEIGGVALFMVQSEMGTAVPGGSLLAIHKAIEDLTPTAVIMVGVAFGIRPAEHQLGDILVSRHLQSYEPQKIKKGEKPILRGDRVTASTNLLNKFRSSNFDWHGAKVHFGLILSGEKLVNLRSFRNQLLMLAPEAIGGEMEGAGLYVAAHTAKVDWLLVKGICDWADGTKNDAAQPLAARNAAAFTLHTIRQGGLGENPTSRVQIIMQGDIASLTDERRSAITDALAGMLHIPSRAIEVYSISAGSIILEIGIPPQAVRQLRVLLQTNNTSLHSLEIEKVVLEVDAGETEVWITEQGVFGLSGAVESTSPASNHLLRSGDASVDDQANRATDTMGTNEPGQPRRRGVIRVYVVDASDFGRNSWKNLIANDPRTDLWGEAKEAESALGVLRDSASATRPDVITLSWGAKGTGAGGPKLNNLGVVRNILSLDPDSRILCVSDDVDPQVVGLAISLGAHGYIDRRQARESLIDAVEQVHEGKFVVSPKIAEILIGILRGLQTGESASQPGETRALYIPGSDEIATLVLRYGMSAQSVSESLRMPRLTVDTHIQFMREELGKASREDIMHAISSKKS